MIFRFLCLCCFLLSLLFFLCFVCAFWAFGLAISLLFFLESLLSPTGQVSVRDKYDSKKLHFTNIVSRVLCCAECVAISL